MTKIDFSSQAEMIECLANACPKLEQQDWQYASDVYEGKLKPVDGKAMFWADNDKVKVLQLRLIALGHATRRLPKDTPLRQAQPLHVKDYAVCQALGVGVVLERCSFDRPDWDKQHPTLTRLKTFVEEVKHKTSSHILICGGTGTGKTTSALSWLVRVVDGKHTPYGKQYNGSFVTCRQIVDHLGAGKELKEFRNRIEQVPYLAIDELEAGTNVSPAMARFINDLMNLRYNHAKPTVITTNASVAEVQATYGERLVSRLRLTGAIFQAGGDDMRVQEALQPKAEPVAVVSIPTMPASLAQRPALLSPLPPF